MNVLSRSTLVDFWTKHPTAEAALSAWYRIVRGAPWPSFADVRATFNSADYVADGKVVFNIGGNNFRLVALMGYRTQRIFILWVGTHAEYDRLNVADL